jgi:uncharacterized protein
MIQSVLQNWEVLLFFFGIALLYSSVGFGGGSSYLAILAWFDFSFGFLRAASLLCNIVVVGNGTIQFYRKGFINFKKTLPLVLSSVPMAFLGGQLPIKATTFFILLGITLLIAGVLLWFQPQNKSKIQFTAKNYLLISLVMGGVIGLLSGVVGIGGGIFLSPLLYFIRWDEPKNIAATCSFFILVNSISGLLGQTQQVVQFSVDWPFVSSLMLSVAIGGGIGSYLVSQKLSPVYIRKATAILILYVSYTVLSKYL